MDVNEKDAKKRKKQEKYAKALATLMELQDNRSCADCKASGESLIYFRNIGGLNDNV